MSEVNVNGIPTVKSDATVNMLGVDVNIATILGEKIAENFLMQITPEQTTAINKAIIGELFTTNYDGEITDRLKTITRYYGGSEEDNNIIKCAKKTFGEKIGEDLKNKINEIVKTNEYKDLIDNMANEITEYAIEGYKEDIKKEIRQRLVDNVFKPTPTYYDASLLDIINNMIDSKFGNID